MSASERPPPHSEDRLGLPELGDIEQTPPEPAAPGSDALGLPNVGDVAHQPSLAGIEHLVDSTLPRPRQP